MDGLTSFAYLTDNLPDWIKQVDTLSKHASVRHAEFAADYKRHLEYARPKKERSMSVQSIHTANDEQLQSPRVLGEPASQSTPVPDIVHVSPLEAGNRYLLAQAQRKRKLDSSIRSGASGPQRFRSKHMVIIYYDAYLQENLEHLVKNIGGARNNLRKGKISRSLTRGLQLPSLTGTTSDNHTVPPTLSGPQKSPTLPTDLKMALKASVAVVQPTVDTTFSDSDKHLEVAQVLCETAAHQVLRDGDCTAELQDVLGRLSSVLELAKVAVQQLEAEKVEQEVQDAETPTSQFGTESILDHQSRLQYSSSKLSPSFHDSIQAASWTTTPQGPTHIEVDDDDSDGSIEVDISKYRSTRSYGLRA